MPRRNDISSILIIGSGPIVIGQACEFDYSGTQACQVLRQEGYRVILVNSNPATIMTDPGFADATYIEPLRLDVLTRIIEKEKPDALLPTMGGQTALNLAMELVEAGVLEDNNVELIGARAEAIATAEDRQLFKEAMIEIGLQVPDSGVAHNMEQAEKVIGEIGLPVVIRPAYILGGKGTGIAATPEEFTKVAQNGLDASRGIPGYRARIRPIVSRITIHWPSFYNVVTGKTLALPNLIALQHIPLSPAGVIAKRPAPIALPNSCAAEWRMAPDAVFSPYASVRYFTPHMVHSQYNLL